MTKKELRRVSNELIKERFEMFSNIKVVELNCDRSTIDKELFINYIVIINNVEFYRVHVSEDNFIEGDTEVFYKETLMQDGECIFNGLYNPVTCEQTY